MSLVLQRGLFCWGDVILIGCSTTITFWAGSGCIVILGRRSRTIQVGILVVTTIAALLEIRCSGYSLPLRWGKFLLFLIFNGRFVGR